MILARGVEQSPEQVRCVRIGVREVGVVRDDADGQVIVAGRQHSTQAFDDPLGLRCLLLSPKIGEGRRGAISEVFATDAPGLDQKIGGGPDQTGV